MGIDSTASWAAIPRLGQSGRLCMGSGPARQVKRFHRNRALAHALSGEAQSVCIMNEPVEDSVGQGRVANDLVPVLHRELAGDDCGTTAVTIFEDLQKVSPLRSGQH